MSGILGIINRDGTPVDSSLLSKMIGALRLRGPDDVRSWSRSNAGLGHALLRTSEAENDHQPLTLDGHVWITADARIDGRAELLSRLAANVEFSSTGNQFIPLVDSNSVEPDDAKLILCAYHAWGEACVKHLIGDFAFAIWDSLRRRLFCARDHFGVKPFYYTATQREFLFSSSPHALRLHPSVTNRLNDNAIGDFLLFDMNLSPSTSVFADIQRLPPGHSLTLSAEGFQMQTYWTLPLVEQLKYKDRQEYVDRFRELMRTAVAERVRGTSTSIFLSGGLDSSVVAGFACDSLGTDSERLKAFTYVYDYLMPDRERHYSSLVAEALGIPIIHKPKDEARLYEWPRYSEFNPAEIINEPLRAFFCDFIRASSEHARVALTGDGGDALFYPEDNYLRKVAGTSGWRELVDDLAFSFNSFGRFPRVGFRTALRNSVRPSKPRGQFRYPEWLNPAFEKRCGLRDRWNEQNRKPLTELPRRRSYESLRSSMWPQLFSDYDPDITCSPVEVRYPFLDIRVVDFLLRLPSLPWCFEKGLLRIASKEQLPAEITKRPKTQIVEDPILVRVKKPNWHLSDYFRPVARLSDYVRADRINKESWLRDPGQIWMHTRPLGLNYWFQSYEGVR